MISMIYLPILITCSSINDLTFIAVCVPLIFGTFINPAPQPIKHPPGNVNFGRL
jgi:hypothetical protein